MTRFEKWLAQQDEGKRADMICSISMCSECPLKKACTNTGASAFDSEEVSREKWVRACEDYLDEEVEEE